MTGSLITQVAGKGIVRIETDHDNGMALLALLAYCDSDGSIAIYSNPSMARSKITIDILGKCEQDRWD